MILPVKPSNSTFNDGQWQAIHEKGKNILVAASAGSGKTTVLIERILTHILETYAQMDQFLVCTFTEAAAREMKERMESRLKQAINDELDREMKRYLVQQLQLVASAHIRTLHSFCLQVIQQFFYLADFDPNFRLITDETQKHLLYQEVWERLLSKIMNNEVEELTPDVMRALMLAYGNGRTDQGLYELVLDVFQFSSSHPEPEVWLKELSSASVPMDEFVETSLFKDIMAPNWQQLLFSALKSLDQAHALLQSVSDEVNQKYGSLLQHERAQVISLLEYLQQKNLSAFITYMMQLQYDRWPTKPRGSDEVEAINLLKQYREQAKKACLSLQDTFPFAEETSEDIVVKAKEVIIQISQLVRLFREQLWQVKQERAMIDYNDLEHLTLNILAPYNDKLGRREASEAAIYYQQQFREVLVDEYQDINDIQATILAWLSHEHIADQTGNLFMVGDVKQSIYGFRMAEPSLFMTKYLQYQAGDNGELIILDQNYRSRDEVLQFTNFIFERLMDVSFGEMSYGLKESLKTGNHQFLPEAPNSEFNIELLTYLSDQESETSGSEGQEESDNLSENQVFDTSIEAEAQLVVLDIKRRVQEKWPIYDKKLKQVRPVEYRDFVVLTATRSPFAAVKRACEQHQIPLMAQNVEAYFQRQEVRLMVELLKLIDNPFQDIALIAILRSYFVGLSDEQLSWIRINSAQGYFYEACQQYLTKKDVDDNGRELQKILQVFFDKLAKWQEKSRQETLVALIWRIYQETDFLNYVIGLDNGLQRQANLHAFYERVTEFSMTTQRGLYGFIRYIEQIMAQENDLAEPVLLQEDQNVVRMMTVHASKGLEFPVVYLMNAAKRFNLQDTTKPYIASKKYGLGTDYFDTQQLLRYPSFIKQAIRTEKVNQLKAEEMRKLYVALTRCEQKLIIVGTMRNHEVVETLQAHVREATDERALVMDVSARLQAKSWYEWLLQAIAFHHHMDSCTTFTTDQITYQEIEMDSIPKSIEQHSQYIDSKKWLEAVKETVPSREPDSSTHRILKTLLDVNYPYQLASNTSSYQSVSELKRLYEEPQHQQLAHYVDRRPIQSKQMKNQETKKIQSIRYTGDTFQKPNFLLKQTLDAAQIGTVTHYVMQTLDFNQLSYPVTVEQLEHQVMPMIESGFLSNEEWRSLNQQAMVTFLNSELGVQLQQRSAYLKREQAFSYRLPAQWLFGQELDKVQIHELDDTQLLVHGVIDLFFEQEDGTLCLIDYKTDRYRPYAAQTRSEQLKSIIDKYRFQMSLYAQALCQAMGKPVSRVFLILLDFEESVPVDTLYQFDESMK